MGGGGKRGSQTCTDQETWNHKVNISSYMDFHMAEKSGTYGGKQEKIREKGNLYIVMNSSYVPPEQWGNFSRMLYEGLPWSDLC